MYIKERSVARGAVFYVSLLFGIGVTFGYYVLAPLSINFLSNFQVASSILNEIDLMSYVSTITTLVMACGLLFQLPMVVYFLTKAGLVTPDLLKEYRKHPNPFKQQEETIWTTNKQLWIIKSKETRVEINSY